MFELPLTALKHSRPFVDTKSDWYSVRGLVIGRRG